LPLDFFREFGQDALEVRTWASRNRNIISITILFPPYPVGLTHAYRVFYCADFNHPKTQRLMEGIAPAISPVSRRQPIRQPINLKTACIMPAMKARDYKRLEAEVGHY
jgi:hypothetical protein